MIINSILQTWHEAHTLKEICHQVRLVPVSQSNLQSLKKGPLYKMMCHLRIPQPRMLQSLLQLPPNTPKKTSRESQNSAWIWFSRCKWVARNQALERICSKLGFRTSTMENPIWSATTSANNVRIILPSPVPLALIEYFLPLFSFIAGSTIVGISISYGTRPSKIPCLRMNSKSSSKKVLETLDYLYMSSGIGLGEIVSTNRKKCVIGPPILNICNPSL